MLSVGDAFWNVKTHTVPAHLNCVLSDPSRERHQIVVVNFTTGPLGSPAPVILPSQYAGISVPSMIAYRKACFSSEDAILKGFAGGVLTPAAKLPAEILLAIQKGLLASPHAERRFKDFLRAQGY